MDIQEVKSRLKKKRTMPLKKKEEKKSSYTKTLLLQTMLSIILCLIILVSMKVNKDSKAFLRNELYEKSFQFAKVNELYRNIFGGILPFDKILEEQTKPVFQSTLAYQDKSKYYDGVSLTVEDHYLVPVVESGTVVYIGEKETYGNVVIIQQVSGVDLWYGNIDNVSVKLYDYVEKGKLLGETKDTNLYFVYQKDGKFVDYHEYLP